MDGVDIVRKVTTTQGCCEIIRQGINQRVYLNLWLLTWPSRSSHTSFCRAVLHMPLATLSTGFYKEAYFLHVTLLARQTNRHWPYGQKVVLRQISRALVTGSSDWVRVPRSGISWQKADNSRPSLACGDELIGWILAQVKPSATCSLSLWLYSSSTCSLRGSSLCLS